MHWRVRRNLYMWQCQGVRHRISCLMSTSKMELLFLGAFTELRKSFIRLVTCLFAVCTEPLGCHWMDFHEIWYLRIFRKLSRKFKFHWNLTRITGTLYGVPPTFMITSRWILLRMRNISEEICTENPNTLFMFNNILSEKRSAYEIMWKIWYRQAGHRWQYKWALKSTICMPDN